MNHILLFLLTALLVQTLSLRAAEVTGKVSLDGAAGLNGALVRVVSGLPPNMGFPPREEPRLIVRNGQLEPPLFVVHAKEKFSITNTSDVAYNVHFRFQKNVQRNVALGRVPIRSVTLQPQEPELFVRISEDLNRLNGYLCVVENPIYAVTGLAGEFKLPDLPPGAYTIEAAHPRTGTSRRQVVLSNTNVVLNLQLPPKRPAVL